MGKQAPCRTPSTVSSAHRITVLCDWSVTSSCPANGPKPPRVVSQTTPAALWPIVP